MAVELIGLKGEQTRILHTSMLKLLPRSADTWHSRESATHPSRAFLAAHHDAVAIIVQFANRARFETRKKRDSNRALLEQTQALIAPWQMHRCF
jgi:hypothetical protein